MNFLKYLFLILVVISCSPLEKSNPSIEKSESKKTEEVKSDKLNNPIAKYKGNEELKLIISIPESTEKLTIESSNRIVLYELNGHGNHSGAESVFRQRTGKQTELKSGEIKEFLSLINNKQSYGVGYAACHEQRLGIVFYDKNIPISYLSLCLACNNLYSKPRIDLGLEGARNSGFNKKSRKIIRKIIDEWGFRDESITIFDHDDSIREILERKGMSEQEIEKELHEMRN